MCKSSKNTQNKTKLYSHFEVGYPNILEEVTVGKMSSNSNSEKLKLLYVDRVGVG